jgi:hypothetical protein
MKRRSYRGLMKTKTRSYKRLLMKMKMKMKDQSYNHCYVHVCRLRLRQGDGCGGDIRDVDNGTPKLGLREDVVLQIMKTGGFTR